VRGNTFDERAIEIDMSTDNHPGFPMGSCLFVAVMLMAIASLFIEANTQRKSVAAFETRIAQVETNAADTLARAKQVQTDLGKLAGAVLLWRMGLQTNVFWNTTVMVTNSTLTNHTARTNLGQ
jgi:hypothetical protein